jgi:serine/threonine-protein kinase HipA
MTRTIPVAIGEEARQVGVLRYNREGNRESSTFTYATEWLERKGCFPVDPGLPLAGTPYFQKRAGESDSVFHGAIADTEPDGWGRRLILRDHAKRRQAARVIGDTLPEPVIDAVDFLLAVDDVARVGALRFPDENGVFAPALEPGQRRTPPLLELPMVFASSRAVETNTETAEDLAYLQGRGTSLGGLRPKCSVRDKDGTLAIGKFPSVHDSLPVTKGEVLALRLARRAGINAARARLEDSEGVPVALIGRFDRQNGGRVPYCSAATMLQARSGEAEEHAYTEIVDMLRRHGEQPTEDAAELWRRVAFSILITNVDDHLHNHGFLHSRDGLWRLSPAFDINPFPDRARELKTWISEDSGPDASLEALWSVIDYFGLSKTTASGILRQVEDAVAAWQHEGRILGLTQLELDPFADAFEHAERNVARRLVASASGR